MSQNEELSYIDWLKKYMPSKLPENVEDIETDLDTQKVLKQRCQKSKWKYKNVKECHSVPGCVMKKNGVCYIAGKTHDSVREKRHKALMNMDPNSILKNKTINKNKKSKNKRNKTRKPKRDGMNLSDFSTESEQDADDLLTLDEELLLTPEHNFDYQVLEEIGYDDDQIKSIMSVNPISVGDAIETGRLMFPGIEKQKSKKRRSHKSKSQRKNQEIILVDDTVDSTDESDETSDHDSLGEISEDELVFQVSDSNIDTKKLTKLGYNSDQINQILSVKPTDMNDAIETGRLMFPGNESSNKKAKKGSKKSSKKKVSKKKLKTIKQPDVSEEDVELIGSEYTNDDELFDVPNEQEIDITVLKKKGYNKEQIATILSVDPTDINDAIETGRLIFPGTEG